MMNEKITRDDAIRVMRSRVEAGVDAVMQQVLRVECIETHAERIFNKEAQRMGIVTGWHCLTQDQKKAFRALAEFEYSLTKGAADGN